MDEHLPYLAALLVESLHALVRDSEVFVIGHKSSAFEAMLPALTPEQYVIDLVRARSSNNMTATYDGICW